MNKRETNGRHKYLNFVYEEDHVIGSIKPSEFSEGKNEYNQTSDIKTIEKI